MTASTTHPTLKDVARQAGCSTAVVSTVVNNAKGNTIVSEDTRQRVLQAAKELGYRPNFASRSLVRRRTHTLGLYIPPGPWSGLGFSYEGVILRGIEAAVLAHGYDLLLLNVAGKQDVEVCTRKFAERRIDGVLLLHVEPGATWIKDLLKVYSNVVAVDYPHVEPGLDTVSFDNVATGELAVEHLWSRGHRRIGFVGSCLDTLNFDANQRYIGYLNAMKSRGVPVRPHWVFDRQSAPHRLQHKDPVSQTEGRMAADHVLAVRGDDAPTAWIAHNDLVAVHFARHLQAAGVRVPQQLSLVGVDDSEWCGMMNPALTSIRHPLEDMGRCAATMLIENSEAQADATSPKVPAKLKNVVFPPEVSIRESTAFIDPS